MSDSLPPMTDEELAAVAELLEMEFPGDWSRSERNAIIAAVPAVGRRLLDEVKRIRGELADFRQMAVLNSKAATEAVDRARSECAALAAKVEELEAQIEAARCVEKGEPCPECGGTVSPWRDVRGKVGFHACTTCTWPLPGPDGKWRTASGMPHTPAQEAQTEYCCPNCYRWAPWTDGVVDGNDEGVEEFWCQTCGSQTPLESMDSRPQERAGDTNTSGTGSGRGTGVAEASRSGQESDDV